MVNLKIFFNYDDKSALYIFCVFLFEKLGKIGYLLGNVLDLDSTSNSRKKNYAEKINGTWVFNMKEMNLSRVKCFM